MVDLRTFFKNLLRFPVTRAKFREADQKKHAASPPTRLQKSVRVKRRRLKKRRR